ncbi:MAG TPA: hypothetical protein VKK79_25280 [Candidatus Lokiarchaeia archaeon]|nr:hypothetical protein [Candidatus Lokiarchaeia archaeon]
MGEKASSKSGIIKDNLKKWQLGKYIDKVLSSDNINERDKVPHLMQKTGSNTFEELVQIINSYKKVAFILERGENKRIIFPNQRISSSEISDLRWNTDYLLKKLNVLMIILTSYSLACMISLAFLTTQAIAQSPTIVSSTNNLITTLILLLGLFATLVLFFGTSFIPARHTIDNLEILTKTQKYLEFKHYFFEIFRLLVIEKVPVRIDISKFGPAVENYFAKFSRSKNKWSYFTESGTSGRLFLAVAGFIIPFFWWLLLIAGPNFLIWVVFLSLVTSILFLRLTHSSRVPLTNFRKVQQLLSRLASDVLDEFILAYLSYLIDKNEDMLDFSSNQILQKLDYWFNFYHLTNAFTNPESKGEDVIWGLGKILWTLRNLQDTRDTFQCLKVKIIDQYSRNTINDRNYESENKEKMKNLVKILDTYIDWIDQDIKIKQKFESKENTKWTIWISIISLLAGTIIAILSIIFGGLST